MVSVRVSGEPVPFGERFEQILGAAKAGGEWAWAELYRETAPILARYLRARGVADAEDVVGETFVRVVRHVGGFEGDEADFRTWLFTIARHLVIDDARRRQRRPADATPEHILHAIGPSGDAEAEALAAIGEHEVRSSLGALTDDQRDVLLLRILGDLSIADVARVLGRREGAVKMLQARGLAALRRTFPEGPVTP